jgi:translation elongation factor EF-G
MPSPAPNGRIRTLALVGAAAAGKTCLAEALLHRAGMIGTPGALDAAAPSATSTRWKSACSIRSTPR